MTISSCLYVFLDVLEGQVVRRGVDQPRSGHHGRGLGQPGGKPEALHFPLHLVARAGAAVVTLERRGLQEKGLHHRHTSWPGKPGNNWELSKSQTWDIAPEGSTAKWVPRQCTVSPNSEVTNTAKLSRSRSGISQ